MSLIISKYSQKWKIVWTRYISSNTRNHGWGTGVLKQISDSLRLELPGLRGFSETNLKNMRLFYEAWKSIESNSSVATDEIGTAHSAIGHNGLQESDNEQITIRQLQLTNYEDFPLAEFLSISFTHHIAIINHAKDFDERLFYIRPLDEASLFVVAKFTTIS